MHMILVDRTKEFCDVLRWQFREHPEVEMKSPQIINSSLAQQRHERVHYGGRWGFSNPRKPVI